jgi:tetratricopeptide (TPR) repeat protein
MVLLPEQGRLSQTSFPRLLLDLHRASFGGAVRLAHDRVEKSLLLRDGIPVYADSNLGSESLGRQLVDTGAISRSDHARLIEHGERSGCKEAKALLDLELMSSRDVFEALKQQVRIRLMECFGWTDGSFRIEPGDAASEAVQPFSTDLYRLLQEGIEAHWSSDRILADLEPRLQQFARRSKLSEGLRRRLHSDDALEATMAAMDGSRTLWKVLRHATTPRALATTWLFDALDAIDYAERSTLARSVAGEDASEIEIVVGDEGADRAAAAATARSGRAPKARPQSPRDAELRQEIAAKHAQLDEADHYALLGVDARADTATIKRAYLSAAKDCHPDALARLGIAGEARDQAGRVFAAIGRAYTVLCNPARRRDYDAQLSGSDLGVDAEQIALAETLYRKGEILLRQGNFRGALQFLKPAVETYPDEADYQNALGWALYKQVPADRATARTHLERAAELAPKDPVVLFRLSVVLRSLGERQTSEELLARAKALDRAIS